MPEAIFISIPFKQFEENPDHRPGVILKLKLLLLSPQNLPIPLKGRIDVGFIKF